MNLINKALLLSTKSILKELDQSRRDPLSAQLNTFRYLIDNGKDTLFGHDHKFESVRNFEDYRKYVPIRDYNQFKPYIDRLRSGEDYILWNQKVKWFAKSSGTSSDKSKFIPISPENLHKCHYKGFKTLIASYLDTFPNSNIFKGSSLTLGGSVHLDEMSNKGAIDGDLSAILLRNSPNIAEAVRVPNRKIALSSDFNKKIEQICATCSDKNVTNFSGVPSWNLILLQRLLEYNNVRYITDIWPNLELFMHGGINFSPYREQYNKIIPSSNMHYLENYNASEGYFAFQDDSTENGMILTLNSGVFYEFVPVDSLNDVISGKSDDVYTVETVSKGVQYALVLSTNSGLWRYLIGDCIEFTSLYPHRITISGRTQLYINVFGEELMINNAENAIMSACKECGVNISDYIVAPIYMNNTKKGGHQWLIEFAEDSSRENGLSDNEIEAFAEVLDKALCNQNSDYEAKRSGNATMNRLIITPVKRGTFYKWMESRGKIGGQNKVPRLCNDRHLVDDLLKYV